MVWVSIVVSLVISLISYVMMPKQEDLGAGPKALKDFKVPTATEDRVIPILFGKKTIESPNVVWYGHLKSIAIRE